jgi:hypothetical protein
MRKENALKADKLEELLLASWTQFLDSSKVLAFVQECVRIAENNFAVVEDMQIPRKGKQITLSRFQIVPQGFILWAEFSVPTDEKIAMGTVEFLMNNRGYLSHIQTLGNLYNVKPLN